MRMISTLAAASVAAFLAVIPGGSGARGAEIEAFAGITGNGSVVFKTGIKSVERTATGVYEIRLRRNAKKCAFFAQPAIVGGSSALDMSTLARLEAGTSRLVRIDMFRNSLAARTDSDFFFQAVC